MKNRFIRIISLALIFSLIFNPINTFASNVDLSRVKFSSGSEPLIFEFGAMKIKGELKQVYPFTKNEIDKLIEESLRSQGLTLLDIKEANRAVEKAKRASEFTKEDMERVKNNFWTTVDTTPVDNIAKILKLVDKFMSDSSWDDIGTASEELLNDGMKEWVKKTATGFVDEFGEMGKNVELTHKWLDGLLKITKFAEMMMDEQARSKQKWRDIAAGANAKRTLNKFYSELQGRIDGYKYQSDQAGWEIKFDNSVDYRTFTFFGVDNNMQTWFLDMSLKQETTNEFGSVAGYYRGTYNIKAVHDMGDGFGSRAGEALRHMKGFDEAIRTIENSPGAQLTQPTSSKGEVKISRKILGLCNVIIDESGEITLTLEEKSDDVEVDISGITVDMGYVMTGLPGQGGVNVSYNISADKEDIIVSGGNASLSANIQGSGFSFGLSGSGEMSVGWDQEIWRHWDGTEKILRRGDQ